MKFNSLCLLAGQLDKNSVASTDISFFFFNMKYDKRHDPCHKKIFLPVLRPVETN